MVVVLELEVVAELAIHPEGSQAKERLRVTQLGEHKINHHGLNRGTQFFV
jgi:hypothetical protein